MGDDFISHSAYGPLGEAYTIDIFNVFSYLGIAIAQSI